MAIAPLPALDRTSPTFRTDTDTFFASQLPTFSVETEEARVEINSNTIAAQAAATTATQKAESTVLDAQATAADRIKTGQDKAATTADRVQTELDRIATGEDKAATAADRVKTSEDRQAVADGLASIADGPVYSVGGQTGNVPLKTLNGAPLTGEGNIVIDSSLYRSARTSNTPLVATDKGKLIDITSGTFTQTFAAAAALGDGWFCYIRNSGTGNVTLDPSGSEVIDGSASVILHSGQMRIIQCDGSALRTVFVNDTGDHHVAVSSGLGHGSTSNFIRRFATTIENVGSAITYADSATLGASFTINASGVYSIVYADTGQSLDTSIGISRNTSSPKASINGITNDSARVAVGPSGGLEDSTRRALVSVVVRLAAGDIIRPHSGVPLPNGSLTSLSIRKVAP